MGKALPNRIREWRKRKSLTIEKLSELAKISPGYLQRMETGGRNVSLKNLDLISAALQVPKQELVSDIEYMKAPLVGYVGAGAETHTFADGQGPFDYVDAPPGSTPETVAVEIRGESLGSFFDQWLVFYDDVHDPPRQELIGKLCVCGLPDGRVLIKKLARGTEPGLFTLLSQFESPIFDQQLDWAARVKTMMPR